MLAKLESALTNALLFTLPWIGLGVVKAITSVDTGAGFQVSYLIAAFLLLFYVKNIVSKVAIVIAICSLFILVAGVFVQPGFVDIASALSRFLKQFVQLGIMVGIMLIPVFRRSSFSSSNFRWLAYGLLFQFVYSILQVIAFNDLLPWFGNLENIFTSNPSIFSGSEELLIGAQFSGIPRIRGTACEPLLLGNYLIMIIPWLLIQPWKKSVRLFLLVIGIILLLLTWSRGAWLGALISSFTAVALFKYARMIPKISIKALGVMLGLMVPILFIVSTVAPVETLYTRLLQTFDSSDWSNLTRIYSMQAAWRAFLSSPIVGIGWGQFAFHFDYLVDPLGLQSQFTWPVVNNFPLKILAETGLLGFGIVFLGVVKVSRKILLKLSRSSCQNKTQIIVAVSSVAGGFGQMFTFSQYNIPHIWIATGLLLAVLYRGEK
jgi:O-antigen ligase